MLLSKADPGIHKRACSVTSEVWFDVAWEWSAVMSFFSDKPEACFSDSSVSSNSVPELPFVVDPIPHAWKELTQIKQFY